MRTLIARSVLALLIAGGAVSQLLAADDAATRKDLFTVITLTPGARKSR